MAASSASSLALNTKLRNLPLKETNKLINILDRNNCWRELAAVITHPEHSMEFLFNSDDISILEHQWKSNSSPGEALLQHWGTYGEELPDIKDLIHFLKQANLIRAISDVMKDLLKIDEQDRELDYRRDINNSVKCVQIEERNIDIIDNILSDLNLEDLVIFNYKDLQMATQNFCNLPLKAGGCKIGEGAYGSVYRAITRDSVFAVKRLKDPVNKQFITELKTLTKRRANLCAGRLAFRSHMDLLLGSITCTHLEKYPWFTETLKVQTSFLMKTLFPKWVTLAWCESIAVVD